MKVGHIRLAGGRNGESASFVALIEALDRLDIRQHVIVASEPLARRFDVCRFVEVGPVITSPVMANCMMPDVDLAHVHDMRAGQAGLIMTLTRSIPFVLTDFDGDTTGRLPMDEAVLKRARALWCREETSAEAAITTYREVIAGWSEFPENTDGG